MFATFDGIIGKTIQSAEIANGLFVLTFADNTRKKFGVEGDCCSSSWIEHLECPPDVCGAKLLEVTDSGNVITSDHDEHDEENGGECISVYNTRFVTDRGEIVLEYRNSSNGYYGGYLVDADE